MMIWCVAAYTPEMFSWNLTADVIKVSKKAFLGGNYFEYTTPFQRFDAKAVDLETILNKVIFSKITSYRSLTATKHIYSCRKSQRCSS